MRRDQASLTPGRKLLRRRRPVTLLVNGHEFVAQFGWRCRTCNVRLDPRLRPDARPELDVQALVDPCPDPIDCGLGDEIQAILFPQDEPDN